MKPLPPIRQQRIFNLSLVPPGTSHSTPALRDQVGSFVRGISKPSLRCHREFKRIDAEKSPAPSEAASHPPHSPSPANPSQDPRSDIRRGKERTGIGSSQHQAEVGSFRKVGLSFR